jgi:hypothetical protein
MIDPLDDGDILGREGVQCYKSTTHTYYLHLNSLYVNTAKPSRLKDPAFRKLTHNLSRGLNYNTTVDMLNSRYLSPTNPFIILDLHTKDLSKQSIFAPILGSTTFVNLLFAIKELLRCLLPLGYLYVIYAHMQRSVLGDPALFRRLCFYPQR